MKKILLVLIVVSCFVTFAAAEGNSTSGLPSFGNFGNISIENFPSLNGFGDNDWFANFEMPENFGSLNWDQFGGTINGGSWGNLDNSEMNSWKDKFEGFKDKMNGENSQSTSDADNGDDATQNNLKSLFEDRKKKTTEAEQDHSQDTNGLRSQFAQKFGSENSYTGEIDMPDDMMVSVDTLKAESPNYGDIYNSTAGKASADKLSQIESSMNKINNVAGGLLSEDVSPDSLTDFSKMKPYKKPAGKDVRKLFESYDGGLKGKINNIDLSQYVQTGQSLISAAIGSGNGNQSTILSLYKPSK